MNETPDTELAENVEGLNQTDLTFQGALFESPVSTDPPPQPGEPQSLPPWWRRRGVWLSVAAVVVFLAVAIVFVVAWWPSTPVVSTKQQPTPAVSDGVTLDAYQLRVRETSQQLKAADPAKPSTSFPLLNKELRLDDKKE